MTVRLDTSQYLTWGLSLLVSNPCLNHMASLSALKSHTLLPVFLSFQRSNSAPCVYQLSCCTANCEVVYVGQTGRKFATRIHENKREFEKFINNQNLNTSYMKSLFSRHFRLHNHDFNVEEVFKPLHFCGRGNLLDLLEVLEINKASSNDNVVCLNDQFIHSSTPFFRFLNF